MIVKDYPNLYQSANNASIKTQHWYITGIRIYLILLVTGVVMTKYAPKTTIWAGIGAVVLLATLLLSIYQAVKRFDIIWYNGRAVAESVKTRTWRFIMRAEPYQDELDFEIVSKHFVNDIHEILVENKKLGQYLTYDENSNSITEEMTRVRLLDINGRRDYYKIKRVDEQRSWYARKARWNTRQSAIWFWCMIVANSIAIVLVILQVAYPNRDIFPVDVFIVLAGSILTWIQVKKFQEISTAYNLTAHEIGILRQNIDFCNTEKKLSEYIKDAENAFSREHTQWVARKNN